MIHFYQFRSILSAFSIITASLSSLLPVTGQAEATLSALEIVQSVNAVPECPELTRKLTMRLTNKHGKVRERTTLNYRKRYSDQKKSLIIYLTPGNVKNTAFLSYDYHDTAASDDQWLYLPAMRKTRRIAASDRGDYFLGTDLTYEDTKKEGKVEIADFNFNTIASETEADLAFWIVEAIPRTEAIANELGYGKLVATIEKERFIVREVQYWDTKQTLLKTTRFDDIQNVDGYLLRGNITVENHKTGHHTEFLFSNNDCATPIQDRWLTKQALARGAPSSPSSP